jgi:hypothetical protein
MAASKALMNTQPPILLRLQRKNSANAIRCSKYLSSAEGVPETLYAIAGLCFNMNQQ